MVKPQFEVGKGKLGKGGVVRDPAHRAEAVIEIARTAVGHSLQPVGVCPSPIAGPAGNRECFLWLTRSRDVHSVPEIENKIVESVTSDRPVLFTAAE
jgi:23S rRNA (cytidine1920-2'-O)/16S rRNA (cytidine1409-2'-O)-methyltransferase